MPTETERERNGGYHSLVFVLSLMTNTATLHTAKQTREREVKRYVFYGPCCWGGGAGVGVSIPMFARFARFRTLKKKKKKKRERERERKRKKKEGPPLE